MCLIIIHTSDHAFGYVIRKGHLVLVASLAQDKHSFAIRVGGVEEPVVALIDHGSEINLMPMDFYKKG